MCSSHPHVYVSTKHNMFPRSTFSLLEPEAIQTWLEAVQSSSFSSLPSSLERGSEPQERSAQISNTDRLIDTWAIALTGKPTLPSSLPSAPAKYSHKFAQDSSSEVPSSSVILGVFRGILGATRQVRAAMWILIFGRDFKIFILVHVFTCCTCFEFCKLLLLFFFARYFRLVGVLISNVNQCCTKTILHFGVSFKSWPVSYLNVRK